MIIEKISEQFSEAIKKIEQEQAFLELVNNLTKINSGLEGHLLSVFSKNGNPSEANNQISVVMSKISTDVDQAVRSARTSAIIVSADRIRQIVENSETKPFKSTATAIELFIEYFDEYKHNISLKSCLDLVASGRNLNIAIHQLRLVDLVLEPTQGNKELPSLTVYIPNHTSLADFTTKLDALTKIIETCCNILSLSMEEALVAIERIESGSFFAKISANPLVVAVTTIIITQGSQYFFSPDFLSSENVGIRENSESVIQILKIRETLSANGVDTQELDSELNSSAILLAKQLNRLLSKSPAIEINDMKFSAPETKLLAGAAPNRGENSKHLGTDHD